jgi:hypothetical protein
VSRRAGVKLESSRAVERGELGELAWQGERSLGSRQKFTIRTVLQVQGGLHGELGLGELQGDYREGEHVHGLENLGWGRGGLQGDGLHRKALWGDLEDGDEHVDGALEIMPP